MNATVVQKKELNTLRFDGKNVNKCGHVQAIVSKANTIKLRVHVWDIDLLLT